MKTPIHNVAPSALTKALEPLVNLAVKGMNAEARASGRTSVHDRGFLLLGDDDKPGEGVPVANALASVGPRGARINGFLVPKGE